MEAWPSSSWIARRSAPPSSRWVANECRSVCGETPAAPRAWSRSRRRTSEVESRRPLFDRKSASPGSVPERRPAAGEVALERAPGLLARRHDPGPAALALHAQLLGVGVEAVRVEVHELLGPQAGRVGQLEHGAVAQLERRRGRDAVEQLRHLGLLQHVRQVGVALRARHEVRRVRLDLAALAAAGGRRCGWRRACARPSTWRRRARTARPRTAAGPGARARAGRARGRPPSRRAARGRRRRRGASSPPCRGPAASRRSARAPPANYARRAWVRSSSTRGTVGSPRAVSSPRRSWSTTRTSRSSRGIRSRAPATRPPCGTRCCASGSAESS